MVFFLKIGFRNLWRNKRRTILASLAMGVGLAALILADGFWQGMINNMVETLTEGMLGQAQVHNEHFLKSLEIENVIKNKAVVLQKIENSHKTKVFTQRVISMAMISSAEEASNVLLYGVDIESEKALTVIEKRIVEGQINTLDGIAIGTKLKKRLGVQIGDRIVITMAEKTTGELAQGLFRLQAVFSYGSNEIDEGFVFVDRQKAAKLLKMPDEIHEIALKFKDNISEEERSTFLSSLKGDENIAESWKELAPGISSAIRMSDISTAIISTILIILVSFGIVNTLFMSLYERLFEFGVLRALGTRGADLLLQVVFEAGWLAFFSILWGIILATIIGGIWAVYGLDYSGVEFAEITFNKHIYFVFALGQFIIYPSLIFLVTIIVSLYPGTHAARMTLSEAMRRSL